MGCWCWDDYSQWIIPENSLRLAPESLNEIFRETQRFWGTLVPTYSLGKFTPRVVTSTELPAGATQQESIGTFDFRHGAEPIW